MNWQKHFAKFSSLQGLIGRREYESIPKNHKSIYSTDVTKKGKGE